MNETSPQPDRATDVELAPLDAFEQQWVDHLAQRDPDLVQSEQAFVQSIMQQAEVASAAGSVDTILARIGRTALPFAIAAALSLAAWVGYNTLTSTPNIATNDQPLANQNNDPSQPDDESAVSMNNQADDRPKVAIGRLIANAKSTATSPANNLTSAVHDAPETLSIDRLWNLVGESVPNLKEILAPLDSSNEQSRA